MLYFILICFLKSVKSECSLFITLECCKNNIAFLNYILLNNINNKNYFSKIRANSFVKFDNISYNPASFINLVVCSIL